MSLLLAKENQLGPRLVSIVEALSTLDVASLPESHTHNQVAVLGQRKEGLLSNTETLWFT